MTELSLDQLFTIAENGPLLDDVERMLRDGGQGDFADWLLKLQQDAGVAIDREIGGGDDDVAPGPRTAALWAAYEPVTIGRMGILREVQTLLPEGEAKAGLGVLISTLGAEFTAPETPENRPMRPDSP